MGMSLLCGVKLLYLLSNYAGEHECQDYCAVAIDVFYVPISIHESKDTCN